MELEFVTRSGRGIFTMVTSNAIHDAHGCIAGTLGMVTDIMERKEVEQRLLVNEKRYRSLVETGCDAVVILAPDAKAA